MTNKIRWLHLIVSMFQLIEETKSWDLSNIHPNASDELQEHLKSNNKKCSAVKIICDRRKLSIREEMKLRICPCFETSKEGRKSKVFSKKSKKKFPGIEEEHWCDHIKYNTTIYATSIIWCSVGLHIASNLPLLVLAP